MYGQNNIQATLLFVDFTKDFDSIHRGKMEQILLAYGLPKETVAAITILYRNTKVKVRSPDGDTEYFDIVAGVLQGDTLAHYLYIIRLDYGNTPQDTNCTATCLLSRKLSKLDEPDMQDTAGETGTSS